MGRYDLTEKEWLAIQPHLPNKPRGVPLVDDRRVLNGIFWVLRSGAFWSDPICFSKHLYKARNLIERFFNKIRYFRRIATRYDKLAENYAAALKLDLGQGFTSRRPN
jgi:transposase